jgi:membrane peptidoglycan carboxypeptidase
MGLIAALVAIATLGGIVLAGLALPAIAAAKVTTDMGSTMFDELPTELASEELPQKSTILAADGTLLATYFDQNRVVVPISEISIDLQHAVVATEDKRFYEHSGVDVQGMGRAFVVGLFQSGQQGASTITQQYIKNVLIEQANDAPTEAERTAQYEEVTAAHGVDGYARKLREAKLAIALEQRDSKDKILEKYLNIAQFGASVYGAETAANFYFSKSAKDLTYVEAATIAGITQNPLKWDPTRDTAAAESRRNTVLMLMEQQGYITTEQYEEGIATPVADTLHISEVHQGCQVADEVVAGSGYFCDYVTKIILTDPAFGATRDDRKQLLLGGGLTITTTLDTRLQALATQTVQASVPVADPSGAAEAMAVVEPGTGQVKALAQNTTYTPTTTDNPGETSINYNVGYPYYTTNTGFQPGSTFKAFTLLTWLEAGHSLNDMVDAGGTTPFQMSQFKASCYGTFGRQSWKVANSEGGGGVMTVQYATANSVNRAFVQMALKLDLCDIMQNAYDLGISQADSGELFDPVPANILGSQNTTPLAMAGAFAAFGASGTYCAPNAILQVTDADGNDLPVPDPGCTQAIPSQTANTVAYAMSHVWEGTMRSVAKPGFPSAGKTGTTNNAEYTWFVGYTPRLSTAVMVAGSANGFVSLDNKQIGNRRPDRAVYGSDIAGPAWRAFMVEALGDGQPNPGFGTPSDELIYGKQINVPSVIGSPLDVATSTLEAAGFSVEVATAPVDSVQPPGTVAQQSATKATAGSVITLTLSSGHDNGGGGGWWGGGGGGDHGGGGGG